MPKWQVYTKISRRFLVLLYRIPICDGIFFKEFGGIRFQVQEILQTKTKTSLNQLSTGATDRVVSICLGTFVPSNAKLKALDFKGSLKREFSIYRRIDLCMLSVIFKSLCQRNHQCNYKKSAGLYTQTGDWCEWCAPAWNCAQPTHGATIQPQEQ